jgi:hypothetical protein
MQDLALAFLKGFFKKRYSTRLAGILISIIKEPGEVFI